MKLDHFNIAAPWDLLETVRDFYVDALGFEEGPRPGFSRRGYWLYSEGRPFIHLIESDAHGPADRKHFLDHIAFRASGAAAVKRRLDDHGVQYRASSLPDSGTIQLFFKDPAGTGLELNFPGEA